MHDIPIDPHSRAGVNKFWLKMENMKSVPYYTHWHSGGPKKLARNGKKNKVSRYYNNNNIIKVYFFLKRR